MTRLAHYDDRWMPVEERDHLRALKAHNQSRRNWDIPTPMIMKDIEPYRNMLDGKFITSRSEHREFLRRNDLIEIGNENPTAKAAPMPSKGEIANDIRETMEQLRTGYVNPEEGILPAGTELKVEDNLPSDIKQGDYIRSDVLPDSPAV